VLSLCYGDFVVGVESIRNGTKACYLETGMSSDWCYCLCVFVCQPLSALTLFFFGWQEGHPACRKLDVGLLVVTFWLDVGRCDLWCPNASSIERGSNFVHTLQCLPVFVQLSVTMPSLSIALSSLSRLSPMYVHHHHSLLHLYFDRKNRVRQIRVVNLPLKNSK